MDHWIAENQSSLAERLPVRQEALAHLQSRFNLAFHPDHDRGESYGDGGGHQRRSGNQLQPLGGPAKQEHVLRRLADRPSVGVGRADRARQNEGDGSEVLVSFSTVLTPGQRGQDHTEAADGNRQHRADDRQREHQFE